MKILNIIKAVIIAFPLVSLTACNDWLGVDMEDSILEEKLYQTDEGYLSVLNGIYSQMNENYSTTLTMGGIDVMAQYYNVAQNSNHEYYAFAQYQFEQLKSISNSVWEKQYFLIANINTLLEKCEGKESKLSATYLPYIKGEALALRAFLHFDLFRLYGPIYSRQTEEQLTIPYQQTSSKGEIQPLLPAKQLIEHIISDLTESSTLLANDKIRKDGVMNGSSDDPNEDIQLRYRQYRLNYYAVQALLARAYMWKGDKEAAAKILKALISENKEKEIFVWTKKDDVIGKRADYLFSTEVMFALYNRSRNKLYDQFFNESVGYNHCLTFMGESLKEGDKKSKATYFFDDMGDLRRDYMWKVKEVGQTDETGSSTGQQLSLCLQKYIGNSNNSFRYMIPLLRMSEVYLMAAECSNNVNEAIEYINAIRTARNCVKLEAKENITMDNIQQYVTAEFAREVIGEGQLYYHYKRLGLKVIPSGIDYGGWYADGKDEMNLSNYVWPLPDTEKDKRTVSK